MRGAIVAAFFLAGCATAVPGQERVCLPPNISLDGAVSKGAEIVLMEAETLGGVVAIRVFYAVGERAVSTLWVGRDLVVIDPEPFNPDAPLWLDGGLVTDDGKIRDERGASCQWHQPISPRRPGVEQKV